MTTAHVFRSSIEARSFLLDLKLEDPKAVLSQSRYRVAKSDGTAVQAIIWQRPEDDDRFWGLTFSEVVFHGKFPERTREIARLQTRSA